ncbi:MAG: NifB/NifX family molybdenum-iron cluster-binding protein [Polyangiaceae bacterium]|jgi:nitrogen fixation protein NifX
MIRVAFASDDRRSVNLHFGAAEQFVLYDVAPGVAELVGIGRFVKARMKGVNAERDREDTPSPELEERMTEDKVVDKIEFLRSCAGVYAAKIGVSSIKRLMQAHIQPIIVPKGFAIEELLNEVSLALTSGGLAWVERAARTPERRDLPIPPHSASVGSPERYYLIKSIDEIA